MTDTKVPQNKLPANPSKRPDMARVYPESDDWKHPGEIEPDLKFNHPIYRRAKEISMALGVVGGLSVAIFHTAAPWWMPFFVFAVTAVIVYRILRPRFRHPSIEDEI